MNVIELIAWQVEAEKALAWGGNMMKIAAGIFENPVNDNTKESIKNWLEEYRKMRIEKGLDKE